jgi:hypothetical protein
MALVTRQEWKPATHAEDTVVCASGKYVVYATKDAKGEVSLILVELGIPESQTK